jgi:hypothetical protein
MTRGRDPVSSCGVADEVDDDVDLSDETSNASSSGR